jgi:hypothetical protein
MWTWSNARTQSQRPSPRSPSIHRPSSKKWCKKKPNVRQLLFHALSNDSGRLRVVSNAWLYTKDESWFSRHHDSEESPISISYMFRTTKMESIVLGWTKRKNKLGVDLLSSKMLETTGRHVETTHTRRLNTPFQVPRDNWPTIFLSEFVYWNVEEFNAESSGLP